MPEVVQRITEEEIKKKEKLFSIGFYISISLVVFFIVLIVMSLVL